MDFSGFELAGHIGVDAGLCWIGDPCYCVTPDCNSHPAKTWSEFCDIIHKDGFKENFKSFEYAKGHEGLGVCVSTGYGDGKYPVYVKKNKEGMIMQAIVDFEQIEEDEDDES